MRLYEKYMSNRKVYTKRLYEKSTSNRKVHTKIVKEKSISKRKVYIEKYIVYTEKSNRKVYI